MKHKIFDEDDHIVSVKTNKILMRPKKIKRPDTQDAINKAPAPKIEAEMVVDPVMLKKAIALFPNKMMEIRSMDWDAVRKETGKRELGSISGNDIDVILLAVPKLGTAMLIFGTDPGVKIDFEADLSIFCQRPVYSRNLLGHRSVKLILHPDSSEALWAVPLEGSHGNFCSIFRSPTHSTAANLDGMPALKSEMQRLINEARKEVVAAHTTLAGLQPLITDAKNVLIELSNQVEEAKNVLEELQSLNAEKNHLREQWVQTIRLAAGKKGGV